MKTVIWDLECTALKANFGVIVASGIKPYQEEPKVLTKGRKGVNDKELCIATKNELAKYDILVGFYSLGFDIKFLNSRLLYWKEKPLERKLHVDLYRIAKRYFNTHSKSLATLTAFLGIEGKTHVDFEHWMRTSLEGDKKSLAYIVEHCKQDLIITEKLHDRLKSLINSISLA